MVDAGKLKKRDKIHRASRAVEHQNRGFVEINVTATKRPRLEWT